MSFKPEIDNLLTKVLGPKNCLCSFMRTDDQFKEEGKDSSMLICPGCSTRDTLGFAIIGYLTGRSSKEVLYKVFEYVSSAHPLKVAEILDTVYTWKDKALKFSPEEEIDAGNWNKKWAYVFGGSIDEQDDKRTD